MTIEKAIDFIETEAMDHFVKTSNYSCAHDCDYEKCSEYSDCKGRVNDLNDIAKYLKEVYGAKVMTSDEFITSWKK